MKSECMEDRQELKRQKRSDFKDDRNFITEKRMETAHSSKANDSSLWTSNEKDFLEDVTLNLIPDDEALNVKGKTVMKWDKLKKRYMLKKVDRDGQVMTEKRNEAGAKITKKNAEKTGNNIYKKWQKETHLSLQRVGEKENKSLVKQARNANESRKMVKQFSSRHKDFNKGDDIRNPQGLIDQKKKRLMNKMNENHARNKRDGKGGRG